ncbi:hypothetical protein MARPO_0144s0024 [Marchantia polymorpha]|uniref:Cytochrome P450 n=1 Tax=Marchantia polymorpha TaxID=3197 RepID=A0A2R6W628_MARPO|nr:hypothetical protein MARPO_0144s0024 [Marchantia polymorpha]|eukprot:PTQ29307.1 hypothetical protein MARPO_0144s0024 [Marchantia polymorpha]
MEILPLVFTAIATVGLYACFYRWVQHRNLRGPRVWPILGSVLDVSRNHWRMHDYAYDYCKKYYPTYVTKMPGFNYVVTVDPANVEHVLKTNFSNYDKGEEQHLHLGDLLGDGIFNADGDIWKKHRKVASYEFASKGLRDHSFHNFKNNAVRLCQILDRAAEENKPVDMMDLMLRLTF